MDIVALEAALDPFCPTALNGGQYHPVACLPWCRICETLLLKKGGAA